MADESTTPAGRSQVPITCPGHSRELAELHYSPQGPEGFFLLSACLDKKPMLRRGENGDWVGTFEGHKGAVWAAKLNAAATRCVTGGGDFSARTWDAVTGDAQCTLVHGHIVKTVEFGPDGAQFATGGKEGVVRVFDLESLPTDGSEARANDAAAAVFRNDETAEGARPPGVSKIVWTGHPSVLVSGAEDGALRAWDLRAGPGVVQRADVGALPMDVELSRDQTVLTVAANDRVHFLDAADLAAPPRREAVVMPEDCRFGNEGGASLHPDGSRFVAGGLGLWVRVWDFASGEELETLKGHHGPVRCVRYAPDGATFASGSEDGTIRIWTS